MSPSSSFNTFLGNKSQTSYSAFANLPSSATIFTKPIADIYTCRICLRKIKRAAVKSGSNF